MSQKYFCPNCGAALEQGVKFCSNCGQSIAPAAPQEQAPPQQQAPTNFAVAQPTQVVQIHTAPTVIAARAPAQEPVDLTQPSTYNRTVALILCLLFGVVGVHHFYVGKSGLGVLYILLSFVIISPFLAIIDLILIISGGYKDSRGFRVLNW